MGGKRNGEELRQMGEEQHGGGLSRYFLFYDRSYMVSFCITYILF